MKKIEIKNRFTEEIIYTYISENATIKDALLDAIKLFIGSLTIEEWDSFFNGSEEFETKRNSDEFKKIQAVYESYKTYINFLNKS